jgi:activator of HSP90 ATPase
MDWDPGVYSMVRFALSPEGSGTKLVLDQDGVPEKFQEHVKTNWEGFLLRALQEALWGVMRVVVPVPTKHSLGIS